ncbi:MAG: hypothetical protein ABSG51_13535, partial [Terracidiphilus sp.]
RGRGEEGKRGRGEEGKRGRGEEGKRGRGEEGKRGRGEEGKETCSPFAGANGEPESRSEERYISPPAEYRCVHPQTVQY